MRAHVLHSPRPVGEGPLALEERPIPVPGPGEVLIRVSACGVCHTDLHMVEGEIPLPRRPIVPGHQVVGVVEAAGPPPAAGPPTAAGPAPAAPPAVGARVGVAWLHDACGACPECRRGDENLCAAARFTGYHRDGGYAGYLTAPGAFVYPIPAAFGDLEAAPLLCAGIIGYRALRLSGLRPGGRLALWGFGASAHIALQVARHRGCEVDVFTRGAAHRRLALDLGAAWAGGAGDRPPAPADGAILFAPAGVLIPPALGGLRKGGTLAIAVIHLDGVPAFDYRLLFEERSIRTVTASTRRDGVGLLEEAAAAPVRVATTPFPFAEANRALALLKGGGIDGAAVLAVSES